MRRLAKRALLVVGVVVAGVLLAALGYEFSLPGVGNAEARVGLLVRYHHGILGRSPVPTRLGMAVVAVEDENYYSNILVDVCEGIARAGLASLSTSGDPGGSTIEQQLAKQLYGRGAGLPASLRELGLGVKLSLTYSKAEILTMYLNSIYYGNHYWGYVAASRGYFGVGPARLDWAQAAMLAGLPQAPSAYDPIQHFALAKQRQLHVLHQLLVNQDLSAAQARAAYREPLHLLPGRRQP
ncbi:MAG TPA: biosynthetic peptidoglycan transglycosylase [Candidatus Dormibacteraeota bacterium]|nr:biosynthetic peptidoglycan transglycosylase [Candidatus Dormibacteraeota bacterium]